MEFRILGPLQVLDEGRELPLGGAKQRALLALLLLDPNRVVARDRLIDELWGGSPPDTAPTALQVYVSHLRKALGRDLILTQPPGYLIRVSDGELDFHRFERLVATARAEEPTQAGRLLREGLALWRGAPLAELGDSFARAERARLEGQRLAALEQRIEAELALGRNAELVPELEGLVREQPLRERLRGQLMLALYRCGRQAEALELYRVTRSALVGELGIEPGPALQRLEMAILLQDPGLELPIAQPDLPQRSPTQEPVQKPVTVVAVATAQSVSVERVEAVLAEREATVERPAAGQIVGLFGLSVVREDDAACAARVALRLRQVEPRARIGIESGKVIESSGQPLA